MLVILTTHPIQYQVPIWQLLAREGRVPFEVWYLSDHGSRPRRDREFGRRFAWDIDLTSGYPHRFMAGAAEAAPDSFWQCRLHEPFTARLRESGATALWIQGWQVAAYWQAAFAAHAAGIPVWLRGESNDLRFVPPWKRPLKRFALGQLFGRVERFLTIGDANRRLYRSYGVPEAKLCPAPYAVDNERFAAQALSLRGQRLAHRRQWGIADDAFCVLFCGKFIARKNPLHAVESVRHLARRRPDAPLHLLFVGTGALEARLREACGAMNASFAGFLNQTEISRAYVAADCLVLPSGPGETWGLVVNEALASGLPVIVSDACGVAADLGGAGLVYRCDDIAALADTIEMVRAKPPRQACDAFLAAHDFQVTVDTVTKLMDARHHALQAAQ
jgi:glycosyltransferase involved in cell wall biosynthesis